MKAEIISVILAPCNPWKSDPQNIGTWHVIGQIMKSFIDDVEIGLKCGYMVRSGVNSGWGQEKRGKSTVKLGIVVTCGGGHIVIITSGAMGNADGHSWCWWSRRVGLSVVRGSLDELEWACRVGCGRDAGWGVWSRSGEEQNSPAPLLSPAQS